MNQQTTKKRSVGIAIWTGLESLRKQYSEHMDDEKARRSAIMRMETVMAKNPKVVSTWIRRKFWTEKQPCNGA